MQREAGVVQAVRGVQAVLLRAAALPEEEERPGHLRGEEAKVLPAHGRQHLNHRLVRRGHAGHALHELPHVRVVHRRRVGVGHEGHAHVAPVGRRHGLHHLHRAVPQVGQTVQREGAHGAPQRHAVGNDVVRKAAVELGDADHRCRQRGSFARNDGLEGLHNGAPRNDGVNAEVGHGRVAPDAADDNLEAVRCGHEGASAPADDA
mmetsp:Transcript_6110/g.20567  ORF Transcript_6110/g.20567 Transcript_6110/m.20567 type:complete len:205 (-) Transcript_6110:691-1305(-)